MNELAKKATRLPKAAYAFLSGDSIKASKVLEPVPHIHLQSAEQAIKDRKTPLYHAFFGPIYQWQQLHGGIEADIPEAVNNAPAVITLPNHGEDMMNIPYSAIAGYEIDRKLFWAAANTIPEFTKYWGAYFVPRPKDVKQLIRTGEIDAEQAREMLESGYQTTRDLAALGRRPIMFADAGRKPNFDPNTRCISTLADITKEPIIDVNGQQREIAFAGLHLIKEQPEAPLKITYFEPITLGTNKAQRSKVLEEYLQDTVGAKDRSYHA